MRENHARLEAVSVRWRDTQDAGMTPAPKDNLQLRRRANVRLPDT